MITTILIAVYMFVAGVSTFVILDNQMVSGWLRALGCLALGCVWPLLLLYGMIEGDTSTTLYCGRCRKTFPGRYGWLRSWRFKKHRADKVCADVELLKPVLKRKNP